jgi:hypothetical protein
MSLATLAAGTFGSSTGPMGAPRPQTFGVPSNGLRPVNPPAPPRYVPAPPPTFSTPSTRPTSVIGEDRFRPYKGTSPYSNRGGVNAYPSGPKPKGYISPY